MYTGMGLSTLGAIAIGAGTFALSHTSEQRGEKGAMNMIFIALPVLSGGIVLLGAGLPLWTTGAVESEPELSVGPGNASLTWRY